MESENTWSLRIPAEMLKLRASRRASPSATSGDPTKWQCANFDVCWSLSSIVHPSPANFRSPLQAASDLNVAVSGCLAGVLCVPDFGGAEFRVCSFSHSLAVEMALVITSSGELLFFSNVSLFLAVHEDHKIHGTSGPVAIPVGGRQIKPQSAGQTESKSIIPLSVNAVSKRGEFPDLLCKVAVKKQMSDRFSLITALTFQGRGYISRS